MPLALLLAGCLACATSVLWIKLSAIEPVLLTALRLSLAAALLAPWAVRDWRRRRDELNLSHLRDVAIPAVALLLHFITWIYGIRLTLATNGTLIVNLTPLATPFLLAALSHERVTPREWAATALAMGGLAILFASDFHLTPDTLWGDVVCLASMLLLATYLVLAKRFRHHPTTLLYVTPLYAIAGAIGLALSPLARSTTPVDWRQEWLWVALLVLLPTVLGHSLINQAMRSMRGQLVSVINMSQFVFAGLMAWAALGERPTVAFYPAAALVAAAGVLVAAPRRRPGKPAPFAPEAEG
ncbi:DMT family transporter [Botrimarina sp.]|uniref:DMT family transporter n=1 Tax=Botrimarina sp. TaxID=2795802 RepID=UPI0032EF183B